MYNVALNKQLFQTGQDFIEALSGSLNLSMLPSGITEHLQSLTAQAASCWQNYSDGVRQDFDHARIFGVAVRSVTLATLAAEVTAQYYWVLRMEYYQNQKPLMDASHQAFSNAGVELLKLIYNMAVELNKNGVPETEEKAAESAKRLQYALHITELGLNICKPKGYGSDSWNPYTSWWLSLRARTLRNLSSLHIHSARFLEEQEKEFLAASQS